MAPRPLVLAFALACCVLGALILAAGTGSQGTPSLAQGPPPPEDALAPRPEAARVYPIASRFAPGEEALIVVEAVSSNGQPLEGPLELVIYHLHEEVHRATSGPVTLLPGSPTRIEFKWQPPDKDFTGYLAVVSAAGRVIGSTGIDVSSTPLAYPRYGFLSEFPTGRSAEELDAIVRRLAQDYHQNMFQFYDWFWRHEQLILREDGQPVDTWDDLFGRTNSVPTIRDLIAATHRYGSLAMAYVMIYAAREGYAELWPIDPSWGMFTTPDATEQLSLDFSARKPGTQLYLFDPANPSWQSWMIDQYVDAIETFRFDGAHIDQVGPRHGVFRADGQPLDLPNAFPSFLQAVENGFGAEDLQHAACTFNIVDGAVDGWAVREVATEDACDFLYSEIWFRTNTYADLHRYVGQLREIGLGRPVVLATYAQYGEQSGPIYEAEGETVLTGAGITRNTPGYTGFGFADSFDNAGDSIDWSVEVPEASTQSLVFRYANGSGLAVVAQVYVNGLLAGDVRFTPLSDWSTWTSDAYLQTNLEGGENTVSLRLDQETDGAVHVDHLNFGQFDEDAVRLQLGSIFASGATPIIIGDNEQSLAHEYYPNRSKVVPPPLKRAIRDYFSFITAYETMLFPPEVTPLEGGASRLVAIGRHRLIDDGGNGIWVVARQIGDYDVLHLVNLVTLDDRWRNTTDTPPAQRDIRLRFYTRNAAIEAVYLATPDFDFGRSETLAHTSGQDERGNFIEFTGPHLMYWDMIRVKYGLPGPPTP